MDSSRLGNLHGNNNSTPPKKRLKPLFANHQQHGRSVKNNIDGTTAEFIYNNFVDEEVVQTAIVGDSTAYVLRTVLPIPYLGGKVNQFLYVAGHLDRLQKCYPGCRW